MNHSHILQTRKKNNGHTFSPCPGSKNPGCKVEQVERPSFVICRYRMVSQPKMLNNVGSNQKSSTIPNFTIFIGGMVTIPKWMIHCFTHMAMNQYLLIPFLVGYSHP